MGTLYDHTCHGCSYTAHVSGGNDVGKIAKTHTFSCGQCRKLVDVVTSPQPYDTIDIELGLETKKPLKCDCGNPDIQQWTAPGPCPRCGEQISRDPYGARTMWD